MITLKFVEMLLNYIKGSMTRTANKQARKEITLLNMASEARANVQRANKIADAVAKIAE